MFPAAFPREIGPLHLLHQKALCVPPHRSDLAQSLGTPRWSWVPQHKVLGAPRKGPGSPKVVLGTPR